MHAYTHSPNIPTSNRFDVLATLDSDTNVSSTMSTKQLSSIPPIAFIDNDVHDRPVIVAVNSLQEQFTLFLDTGSPVSIMDTATHAKFFPTTPIKKVSNVALNGMGKGSLNCVGIINPIFYIANQRIQDEFVLVDNVEMNYILLIGHSLMRRHRIVWDPVTETALVNGKRVRKSHTLAVDVAHTPDSMDEIDGMDVNVEDNNKHVVSMDFIKKAVNNNTMINININKDHEVPPRKHTFVRCKVKRKHCMRECLIEDINNKVPCLILTDSIVKADPEGNLIVGVTNTTNKSIYLQDGTLLTTSELFENPIVECQVSSVPKDSVENKLVLEEIDSKLSKDIPDTHAREQFRKLLRKHVNCFSAGGNDLGLAPNVFHDIQIEDSVKSIYTPSYRIPFKHREEVDRQISDMLDRQIIQHSTSPYNSPLLCVPKKGGETRIVIDYRKINAVTQPDRFPTHNVEDILMSFAGAKYFTSIDLVKGFHQIAVSESSRKFTAFSTPRGHWEFLRMPFGLRNAPITFTRLIRIVFGDLLGNVVQAYMDDIVVSSQTLQEHLSKLSMVLGRLEEFNLKIKLKKCEFFQTSLQYLGFVISTEGLQVVGEKAKAISNFPVPKNVKSLMTFLGMTGFYRKFIFRYSSLTAPLTDLLRKDTKFVWSEIHQSAFEQLKEKLLSPPILVYPNYQDTFYLASDASDTGIGGVLLQKHGNKMHPCSFYSRKLRTHSPNETAYATIDKECLAIANSLLAFKYIIYGCNVVVLTDHQPLTHFFKHSSLNSKRTRWQLLFEDFDITIRYLPGKMNVIADALSRNSLEQDKSNVLRIDQDILAVTTSETVECNDTVNTKLDWDYDRLRKEQMKEKKLRKIISEIESGKNYDAFALINNVLHKVYHYKHSLKGNEIIYQVLIPFSMRSDVLKFLHNSFAHPGYKQMYQRSRLICTWRCIGRDIHKYIKNCHTCSQNKGVTYPKHVYKYPTTNRPFSRVHMDILGGFNETARGNKHVLVCVDSFTRYTEIIALKNKTAVETASKFYSKFICRYGIPHCLITDSGNEFNNSMLTSLCQHLNIQKANIVVYHPSSNGIVERANRKLLDVLRITIGAWDSNWDNALDYSMWVINTCPHKTLRTSPFEALFGYPPPSPLNITNNTNDIPEPLKSDVNSANARFKLLKERLESMDLLEREEGNEHVPQRNVGDLVYIRKHVRKGLNYKLDNLFDGPFEIIRILRAGRVVVRKNNETKTVCEDQIRRF